MEESVKQNLKILDKVTRPKNKNPRLGERGGLGK